jgi:hypothetical protein
MCKEMVEKRINKILELQTNVLDYGRSSTLVMAYTHLNALTR